MVAELAQFAVAVWQRITSISYSDEMNVTAFAETRILDIAGRPLYQPRKTPLQARSTVTVDAILEATIQVLQAVGLKGLTTIRVAKRAGVSIGTLYQYYPNKQSLLLALLDAHMCKVSEAVERFCVEACGMPVCEMLDHVIPLFIEAKMMRNDIAAALYKISHEVGGPEIVAKTVQRACNALHDMIRTAPDLASPPDDFVIEMMYSATAGATRTVLEAGAPLDMIAKLKFN